MSLSDMVASVMVFILFWGGVVTLVLYLRRVYDRWIVQPLADLVVAMPPTQRELMRRAAHVANARHEQETLEQMWLAPTTEEPK